MKKNLTLYKMPYRKNIRRRPRKVSNRRTGGRKLRQFSQFGLERLASAYGGYRPRSTGRRGWIAGDKAILNKPTSLGTNYTQVQGGDYTQFTQTSIKTGRPRKVTLNSLTKELRNKNELTIYRYQGLKQFDNWGTYWMSQFNSAGVTTYLPMYIYDLTAIINSGPSGVVNSMPFGRFYLDNATGRVLFTNMFGQKQDGTSSMDLQLEKASSTSTILEYPHEKSRLLWNSVNLTLWGAKQKAVKYTIQVVKLDERLDPWKMHLHTAGSPDDHYTQSFYQGVSKPICYNPIAFINPGSTRGVKVLKTYTTTIQPTSTTENDADPHSKILKWFMRWDRDLNYKQDSDMFVTRATLLDEPDFNELRSENDCYTTSKSKIYLFIKATNFMPHNVEDSTLSGSFDLMVRSCHVAQ